jgi:hypothetical protein
MPGSTILDESDRPHVAAELAAALGEWNERQAGPRHHKPFTLAIRGDDGQLVAGLLRQAEAMALERTCSVAFLNTMSFQTPGFYEKCGYHRFAELPYAPAHCGRIWFVKQLTR